MPDTYSSFGKYLLLKQITQDGLGTLWRAGEMEATGFKRIAWLRRFEGLSLDRATVNSTAGTVAGVAQALKATNVVRNLSFGSERGTGYMVWDYVPAQALDLMLTRVTLEQFPVAIDNALLITEKITAALGAAQAVEGHASPLIHGFLIPHLIMVGNDGEAMVAGFGTHRAMLANLSQAAVRETAAPYLAPEVLASAQVSPRSDVYSVGAILYHLLCGVAPSTDPAARAAALESPQLAFDEGPVPADILAILRKTMATRPEERFASAADLKKELEKLLYGGAYSPTTFNLALFMDRLYRSDIEEEDRELQKERALDVSAYYQAPKVTTAPIHEMPAATESAGGGANRNLVYLAIAAGVVLLGVIGYLVASRPSAPSQEELARLINSEVTKRLAEEEDRIRKDLEAEKQKTERLAQELEAEKQKVTAPGSKQLSPEEKAKVADLQRQYDEAEARKRAKVQEQQAQEAAKIQAARASLPTPTATPVVLVQPTAPPMVVPTTAPALPTAIPVAPTATSAPVVVPTSPPAADTQGSSVLASDVREGDLIDVTLVDVVPQVLVPVPPNTRTAAARLNHKGSGVVILSVLVNEKGTVDDVKVLRSFPGPKVGIDDACMEAVKQYRYKPATKGGVKVKTWTTTPVPINLERARK
jgi:TonB family protein